MFSYRAADAAGNVIQGTLEAREERQVVAPPAAGRVDPLAHQPGRAATQLAGETAAAAGPDSHPGSGEFHQELAALLKAGLPWTAAFRPWST